MQFFKSPHALNPPKPTPQNPFTNIQTHVSHLSSHFSTSLQSHFHNFFSNQPFQFPFPFPFQSQSQSRKSSLSFARAFPLQLSPSGGGSQPMPMEVIEERLAGVPVYALSNSAEEFALVSGLRTGKSLGLLCFKREDAEALLLQMKAMDPGMRQGSKVVPLALNKVCQLKVDGVAFRFIPDLSQVLNAVKEKQKLGDMDEGFSGVPVFQSQSLVLTAQNKQYRPVFFRKEDLDKSLTRAARQQKHLNPALRKGDIQVFAFEEILKGMKENNSSIWDDVVFIPPGFDVATYPSV